MIYKIFRFWANIAIRVFYGKIEVNGMENVPLDGPLLIASNHPNGFLEPIIMACLFPRPLHFMVRGDVFRKTWLKPILVNTNQIPIFRFKDGFSELRKNDASLQVAYDALDKNAAIILFIEGGTKSVKTLRPFQKGLSRMAHSYIERDGSQEPLKVLPVAINFVSPFVLRSRVVLNIGESFEAQSYFQSAETKVKDIKRLTDDLYCKIEPMAFNVSQKDRQSVLNQSLRYAEGLFSLPFFPMVRKSPKIWPTLKSVANSIRDMDDVEYDSYKRELENIEETEPYYVQRTGRGAFIASLWAIVAFVPGMIGLLLNIIPGVMSQMLAKKALTKDNTVFVASIILSSGVGFYVIYYALMTMILSLFFGWKGLLFVFAWPLGFVYLFWKSNYRSSVARTKYHLSEKSKTAILALFAKYKITLENTNP